jgi:polysaccharide biosynthesis transport protein
MISNADRGGRSLLTAEVVHIPINGTRLNALAEVMSQNPAIEDAYIALFGSARLSRPLVSGKSILVTSTAPGEGKTTVASCLAITASLAGQSVLLVDGDLRRLTLASALGIAHAVGLTEVLSGEIAVQQGIHPVTLLGRSPKSATVNVMAGGRKSPVVLPALDWTSARNTFQSVSQTFDLILVDSPPILAANDALLLANIVDAVLMVVGAGNANLEELRRAKEQLEQTSAPVIGAVLNRFDGQSNQPYGGYYRRSEP